MAVFRVEKNRNYTVMSNVHLKDRGISLKAKGYVHITMQVKMTKNKAARFIVFPPPVTSHKHHIMAELWYFMPFSFCS